MEGEQGTNLVQERIALRVDSSTSKPRIQCAPGKATTLTKQLRVASRFEKKNHHSYLNTEMVGLIYSEFGLIITSRQPYF